MRFLLLLLFSISAFGNSYYTPSGVPQPGTALSSAPIKNEFVSIKNGFDRLPDLTALPANEFILVNSAGNALVPVVPSTALNLLSTNLANLSTITPGALGESILATATAFTFNLPMGSHKITGLAAGSTAGDSVEYSQANTAIATADQSQTYTSFTTGGTTGAFTLAPSPAIASLSAGSRFNVTFSSNGNGSDTLAVSGLTAKTIKQASSTGALVNPVIISGMVVDVQYNGTYWVILNPLPPSRYQTGDVKWFAYSPIPSDWLAFATAAGGSQIQLIATYPALAALLGTTWGGDGVTTFGIPWLVSGGVPLHAPSSVGAQTHGAVISHTHTHNANSQNNVSSTPGGQYLSTYGLPATIGSTGGTDNLAAGAGGIWAIKI